MKILQIGAPKCGNMWLYNILRRIREISGDRHPTFIEQQPIYELARTWELNYPEQASIDMIDITDLQTTYRISSIFKMPIDDFREYASHTNHVWTHSPYCPSSDVIYKCFDKKVYIIRDPRDRAISAANYYCSPYMLKYFPQPIENPVQYLRVHFDDLIKEWIWHVYDHLKYSKELNIYILKYEALLHNFQEELKHLLNYLELELDKNTLNRMEEEMSFSEMKKQNPKHLRKGTSGYWKEHLSKEQQRKARLLADPLLEVLNYNSETSKGFTPTRKFDVDFDSLLEKLGAHKKTCDYPTQTPS